MTYRLLGILLACAACARDDAPAAAATTAADSAALPPPRVVAATVSAGRFATLRWIEGRWRGSDGTGAFYESYRFADDSTIRTYSYPDSATLTASDSGEVALRNGTVVSGTAAARWVAAELDSAHVRFVPDQNVTNSFTWLRQSPDRWTATLSWPAAGDKPARETIYQMERMIR